MKTVDIKTQAGLLSKSSTLKLCMSLLGLGTAVSAQALGLGNIQVQAVLNQPFYATIPLQDLGSINPQDVKVGLASLDKYNEMGIDRPGYLSHFDFKIDESQPGQVQIVVTSDIPIDSPIVSFLMVIKNSGTQFYREYTVFLDPSSYASLSAGSSSGTIRKPSSTPTQTTRVSAENNSGWYGPTANNDTLWGIAERYHSLGSDPAQVAVAIYNKNPSAFIAQNANKLKAGVRLHLPSSTEVNAVSKTEIRQVLEEHSNPQPMEEHHLTAAVPSAPVPLVHYQSEFNPSPAAQPNSSAASAVTTTSSPETAAGTMVLPVSQPSEAEVPTAQTPTTSTANTQTQAQLDEVVKTLKTEEATNQLMSSQMSDLQHRNEELQHDLSEKDQLLLNLQALLNQKQQAKVDALPGGSTANQASAAQGGEIPLIKTESSSWGLWLSLAALLLLAGAAYWKRDQLQAFVLALRSQEAEEEPEKIMPDLSEQKIEPKRVEASGSEIQQSAKDPLLDLSRDLLISVEASIQAERYTKAELDLSLFLSHYPNQIEVSLKLLEVYALMKKKSDFDRLLHHFEAKADLSSEIHSKVEQLKKIDWSTSFSLPQNEDLEETQDLPSDESEWLDEKVSIEKPIIEDLHSTSPKESIDLHSHPVEEHVKKADPSFAGIAPLKTQEAESPMEELNPTATEPQTSESLSTKSVGLDFVSGLDQGLKPSIRGAENLPVESSIRPILEAVPTQQAPALSTQIPDDSKEEAKLDLAGTYLSMQERGAARKLLDEVIASKSSSLGQRKKAEQILKSIDQENGNGN